MKNKSTISDYCKDNILVLPGALKGMEDASCLMENRSSAIFYKELHRELTNVEFYCNSPCFVFVKEGQETITSSSDTQIIMRPEQITYLPKGVNLHSDYVKTSGGLKAYLIFLDQDVVKEFLSNCPRFSRNNPTLDSSTNHQFITFNSNTTINHFFESINLLSQEFPGSSELLPLKLLEFLNLLVLVDPKVNLPFLLTAQKTISPKRNVKRLLRRPEYLKLSVTDLAQLSGRSLSSFNRDFRATYNTTPKQWLKHQRLSHAQAMLREKDISITDISLDVGYENVSHFIKSYKDIFGITPGEYRQKLIENLFSDDKTVSITVSEE